MLILSFWKIQYFNFENKQLQIGQHRPLHGDDFNDDLLRETQAKDDDNQIVPASIPETIKPCKPVEPRSNVTSMTSADDAGTLLNMADTLTNPPEMTALSNLLGRLALAQLDPLPERQILDRIKCTTGIAVSILTKQMAELHRRVNATGNPNAGITKPAWYGRLRTDMTGSA